eukprot:Clim_evm28s9 gene=Clim_evmTU28s9
MGNSVRKQELKEARSEKNIRFTERELKELQKHFHAAAGPGNRLSRKDFFSIMRTVVSHGWSEDNLFLSRLFAAFDEDNDGTIDFMEFIKGFNVFLKGSFDEKLELTFKLIDVNRNDHLDRDEFFKILQDMYQTLSIIGHDEKTWATITGSSMSPGTQSMQNADISPEDRDEMLHDLIERIFQDLDINNDNQISIAEFRLLAIKEPMLLDFISNAVPEDSFPSPSPGSPQSLRGTGASMGHALHSETLNPQNPYAVSGKLSDPSSGEIGGHHSENSTSARTSMARRSSVGNEGQPLLRAISGPAGDGKCYRTVPLSGSAVAAAAAQPGGNRKPADIRSPSRTTPEQDVSPRKLSS